MGINIGQVDPRAMQKLLFGGPQSLLTAPPDAQQPTPQASAPPDPGQAPQPGAIAKAMPQAAPTDQPTAAPVPPKPMSQSEFAASNPDMKAFTPTRPVGDFDKLAPGTKGADSWGNRHNDLRRVLASLFAGSAEFGGELNHHPGEGAAFTNRWMGQDEAQRQYDNPENQEKMKAGALSQAYQNYLGQQSKSGEIQHTGAETGLVGAQTGNLAMNPPGKAEFLKELQGRRSTGADDPDQLFKEYATRAPYAHATRQEIADVIGNTPVKPFNFETKEGAIQPASYLGKTYGPTATAGEPPEIATARQNALASIKQGQSGKIAVAKEEAKNKNTINLGNFGQAGDPMVDMVGQGRVDLQTALQRVPPQAKESFMSSLNAKYPGFNQSTYGIGKNVGEAFTAGPQGQQLTAINTAREHMKTFQALAEALDNGNMQASNQIGNALGVQFGNDKATNFKIAAQAFGGEVGKAFDGAGVTEGERKQAQGAFNPNMSPQQFRGAIQTVDSLLAGKQKSLQSSYESGRQGKPNFGGTEAGRTQQPPAGATHIVPGPDGKRHYTNAVGTVDLGIAP